MAPHHPAASMPIVGGSKFLETAYHDLQTANEQLRCAEREICRLMTAKMVYFPNESESSDHIQKYGRGGFEDEDWFKSDWWNSAVRTGLFESVDNLDRELEKANASKTNFAVIQSTLRSCINELSRPHLRNISILDLPNEILLQIFEVVEGLGFYSRLGFYSAGTEDIKTTRLVCRRFCDVSSQLLVRQVRVSLNEPSLARLEKISRHPTIAKGVRVIRVVLHFYNNAFIDLDRFISYHTDEAAEQVRMLDRVGLWDIPEQTASQMIAKGRTVVSTLRRLASAAPGGGGYSKRDENHRARLKETHQKYLSLLEKQDSLISSGEFSRAVGSAFARMPRARELVFSDTDFEGGGDRRLIKSEDDAWGALHSLMLLPVSGYHVKLHNLELPDYRCITNTIHAIRCTGTFLNSINIDLSVLGCSGTLVPGPAIRQGFLSGMQQLKEFAFKCNESLVDEQDAAEVTEFLSACLDTSSLQGLTLDMRGEGPEATIIDVARAMGSRPRHKLTYIFLGRVAIDLSKLVLLLKRLSESMSSLNLEDARLLSGTWKDALDALREKESRVKLFSEPQGAECDDMSHEDYERIFCDSDNKYAYGSEAQRYITSRGPWARNPLQALEEGELSTAD